MCGIFGLIACNTTSLKAERWSDAIQSLFTLSETRGKEAAGIALATDSRLTVHKDSVSATNMIGQDDYKAAIRRGTEAFFDGKDGEVLTAIGHSRLVTNGLQGIDANNQPIWRDDTVLVHNGIITNLDELWAAHPDLVASADVDTEILALLINKYRAAGKSPAEAVKKIYSEIYGETSIAVLFRDLNILLLATNTGSLYTMVPQDGSGMVFTSEYYISTLLQKPPHAVTGYDESDVVQISPGHGLIIDLGTLETTEFDMTAKVKAPLYAPRLSETRSIDDKTYRIQTAIDSLQRCTKCILPETMPYIEFDADGVCSYCHSYQPIVLKAEKELEAKIEAYKTTNGRPDCMMAFSGGRDSSFGMHLLKEKYGMNPLAFSYDWGMVTDLGRRNQSRMCAALGIEHIWVSANIKQKRSYIRKNVEAWMRRPDIGITPLFIAGDKHTFVESNRVMDETGLELAAYAPNQLENTYFKTAFCGIKPNFDLDQPFALGKSAKIQLARYYGWQFLRNPRYINRSMLDTFTGFKSLYYQARDYLYMFDYLPWDENQIDETLIGTYGWERSHETECTWRIGDGTAPFYNYTYHTVCGFTEHDTFRSNQIREGMITRDEALAFIARDNQPRWDGFREYCSLINVDFDELVRTIDQMPKLYINS